MCQFNISYGQYDLSEYEESKIYETVSAARESVSLIPAYSQSYCFKICYRNCFDTQL